MKLDDYLEKIRAHPDFDRAGMILSHVGVVRRTSGDGRKIVDGLTVSVDHKRLQTAVEHYKQTPGIVDILVDIAENRPLAVGETIMVLVVAGDVRETVLTVLSDLLDEIKTRVAHKVEHFAEPDGAGNA